LVFYKIGYLYLSPLDGLYPLFPLFFIQLHTQLNRQTGTTSHRHA